MTAHETPLIPAPNLPYLPQDPKNYRPGIGLIGCGGITKDHLKAYRSAGYHVVALCDVDRARAENRQQEYFPEAEIYSDYRDLLRNSSVEVVDITTHTPPRPLVPLRALALVPLFSRALARVSREPPA